MASRAKTVKNAQQGTDSSGRIRRLPPLNSLRMIEAVAMSGSFSKAAAMLNVSPSAVKQQVVLMEDFLGKKLFETSARGAELTDLGEKLIPQWRSALDLIEHSVGGSKEQLLRIDTINAFAIYWLNPRLNTFRKKYPHIRLMVNTSSQLVNFGSDSADMALRYGRGVYPPAQSELLTAESTYAVCSPELAAEVRAAWQQKNYDAVYYLFDVPMGKDTFTEWDLWADKKNLSPFRPAQKITYSDSALLIDAALRGEGVMISRHSLLAGLLKQKRLVRLEDDEYDLKTGMYMVYPSFAGLSDAARLFRQWLKSEMDAFLQG